MYHAIQPDAVLKFRCMRDFSKERLCPAWEQSQSKIGRLKRAISQGVSSINMMSLTK